MQDELAWFREVWSRMVGAHPRVGSNIEGLRFTIDVHRERDVEVTQDGQVRLPRGVTVGEVLRLPTPDDADPPLAAHEAGAVDPHEVQVEDGAWTREGASWAFESNQDGYA